MGLAMRQSGPVGLRKILLEHLQFWWPQSGLKKRDHRALLGFSSELNQPAGSVKDGMSVMPSHTSLCLGSLGMPADPQGPGAGTGGRRR